MSTKTLFFDLPQCTADAIGDYLTDKDITELALTSNTTHDLFQPYRLQKLANKLLLYVMHGEQDKAEILLKRHPELLEIRGQATDYSGRTFNTTAFRYALWALDTRYMCNMMLDCSPQSETINKALLTQFNTQKQHGVEYELNGVTFREKHYDFSPLIQALQAYVNHFNNQKTKTERDKNQWIKVIGLAQRNVPAHVAQHYCDYYESFSPTPSFDKKSFVRCLDLQCEKPLRWFDVGSNSQALGVTFGISRGWTSLFACGMENGAEKLPARLDLDALTALCQVRTADLHLLVQRLECPFQQLDTSAPQRGKTTI